MAENAERGVIFTLKANVDPSAKQIIEQFAQDIQAKQSLIDEAIRNAAQASAVAIQSQTSQSASVATQNTGVSQDAVLEFFANTEQAAKAYADNQAQRSQEEAARQAALKDTSLMTIEELYAERNAVSVAAFDREKQIYQDALDEERAAMETYFAVVEELRKKAEADAESVTDEEVALVQQLEREAVNAVENREKAEEKFRRTEARERSRAVTEQIGELQRQRDAQERTAAEATRRNEQISQSAGRIVSALSEGTESVMRFARGISHLGLIGETDLQKLTDSLLAIQGTTEIFTGLIRTVRQVSEGYDAYRRMVTLATEAQIAHNAAVAAGAATQGVGVGAAVGGQVPLMARGVMAASGVGSAIAGAAGGIGLAAGGSGLTIFLASLGTAATAVAGLGVAALAASEAIKNGIGGGANAGGVVESIGTSAFNPFFQIMRNFRSGGLLSDERGDAKKAYDDAEAAEKKLTIAQEQRKLNLQLEAKDQAAINEMTRERSAIMAAQAQAERQLEAERMAALSTEERLCGLDCTDHRDAARRRTQRRGSVQKDH